MSEQLRMPFGKYKGQPFAEIPDSFYTWAAESGFKIGSPNFAKQAAAFEAEKVKRLGGQPQQSRPQHQSKPTSGIPRERIVMGIELIKRQCNQTAVHDALDSLLRMLDSVEQPSQARPAPTDGAPKKSYVDYPDPPEDEEESGVEDIPF